MLFRSQVDYVLGHFTNEDWKTMDERLEMAAEIIKSFCLAGIDTVSYTHLLQKATQYSKEMGDEFVSLEPIILALLTVKSTVSTILKDCLLYTSFYRRC